jgi:C-terminal processing protease CtpA/Prc
MLIGRETAGDPLIREPILLSTGRYALLATREIRTADGVVYWGAGGVKPDVVITDAALNETVFEPDTPMLRKSKILTEEDKEDKALRDRTRHDTYLRRATDVLLGLQALGYDGER